MMRYILLLTVVFNLKQCEYFEVSPGLLLSQDPPFLVRFLFHEKLKGRRGCFCVSVLLRELFSASRPCMLFQVTEGSCC